MAEPVDPESGRAALASVTGSDQQDERRMTTTIALPNDPDGRLVTQFTKWGITRAKLLELAELAADKDPLVQEWLTSVQCLSESESKRRSYESLCRDVGLPVTSLLGHILREWENEKLVQTRTNIVNRALEVSDAMIEYAISDPKASTDRANVMKITGVLKESGINVNVNQQMNTQINLTAPNPDEGILKRFDLVGED